MDDDRAAQLVRYGDFLGLAQGDRERDIAALEIAIGCLRFHQDDSCPPAGRRRSPAVRTAHRDRLAGRTITGIGGDDEATATCNLLAVLVDRMDQNAPADPIDHLLFDRLPGFDMEGNWIRKADVPVRGALFDEEVVASDPAQSAR